MGYSHSFTPMSDYEDFNKKLTDSIAEHGWHVIKVMEDGPSPEFCFSVGLYKTFGHPEIIIIGLDMDLAHELINLMGDEISAGGSFTAGEFYEDIIEDYACYMLAVEEEYYEDWIGTAIGFYGAKNFPVLQCVYPNMDRIYPWQPEWPEEMDDLQPLLGEMTSNPDPEH